MSIRIATGCAWDLKTRAEKRAEVAIAVALAMEALKPASPAGIITAGDGTILDGNARAVVCQNTIRVPGKNASTAT